MRGAADIQLKLMSGRQGDAGAAMPGSARSSAFVPGKQTPECRLPSARLRADVVWMVEAAVDPGPPAPCSRTTEQKGCAPRTIAGMVARLGSGAICKRSKSSDDFSAFAQLAEAERESR